MNHETPQAPPPRRPLTRFSGLFSLGNAGPRALLVWSLVFVLVGTSYAATLGVGLWIGVRLVTTTPDRVLETAAAAAPLMPFTESASSITSTPSTLSTPPATSSAAPPRFASSEDFAREFTSQIGRKFAAASQDGNDRERCVRKALDEAERLLDAAETQFPDDPVVVGYRGVVLYYRERFDLAAEYLGTACDALADDTSCQPRRTFDAYRRWATEKAGAR